MKVSRLFLLLLLGILVISCEKNKEPFYQVTPFETRVHDLVSDYRKSEGLNELVFFQDIFIEAREQSTAWKNSGDESTGIYERLGTIQDHWNPSNLKVINTSFTGSMDTLYARLLVEYWIADSATNVILLDDFVQSGPGAVTDGNGNVYVTYFLAKILTK